MFFAGVSLSLVSCSRSDSFAKVNVDESGVAIGGFDAVAYFAVENAVAGNTTYEYAWNGAKWLFANAENLEKFKLDPEAYAPQFGGYCSYAVSKGYTADGDPRAWKIVDGKLYLNYNADVRTMWEKDQAANIVKGKQNWSGFEINPPVHK